MTVDLRVSGANAEVMDLLSNLEKQDTPKNMPQLVEDRECSQESVYSAEEYLRTDVNQSRVYELQDNETVFKMRNNALIGHVIQGTLITTIRSSGKKTYWVRWNMRKCDQVLVTAALIEEAFGTAAPVEGSQISCTIDALGPDYNKLKFKSAWCMHPQTKKINVVSVPKKSSLTPVAKSRSATGNSNTLSSLRRQTSQSAGRGRFFNSRSRSNSPGARSWRNSPSTSSRFEMEG
jgi:hypothetical protein